MRFAAAAEAKQTEEKGREREPVFELGARVHFQATTGRKR